MAKKQNHVDELDDIKSKTKVKQEMHDLQALGLNIAELPKSVYKSLNVPESLDEAIQTLKRIKNNNAQKRQRQYIGRVMREIDAEPLQKAYNDYLLGRKRLSHEFAKLEDLRDEFIEGNQEALEAFLTKNYLTNRQKLMQLIRNAQKEHSDNEAKQQSHKVQYKKLYQFLKDAVTEQQAEEN